MSEKKCSVSDVVSWRSVRSELGKGSAARVGRVVTAFNEEKRWESVAMFLSELRVPEEVAADFDERLHVRH
ncbi:MAG: hypothetical protein K6F46_03745 [Desulfovibrio sp.]|nr:hypothetical protein [Desulfovibrio sp.]